jgi:hypothetical protein
MPTLDIRSVLLALCAEPPSRDAVSLKDGDITELIRLANRHGVLSLVSRALSSRSSEAELRRGRESAVKRALVFTAELIRILDVLGKAGIPAIPLRGPVIGELLHGDAAVREFSDLDILVHREDVTRVTEALLANSFRLQSPQLIQQECLLRWGFEISMQRGAHGPCVDVHWQLGPGYYPFALPAGAIWSALQTVSFERRPIPFPSPECLLLTLCIHGAKHHWERLKWLCDVQRLVDKGVIDWDETARMAAASRCEPPLLLGLYLAHELLGAEVPATMLERARRSTSIQELAGQVRERMFSEDRGPYSALESCAFHFRLAGFRGGLRFAMGVLLIPTDADWNWVALPRRLRWLYYPLRLVRFAWKYTPLNRARQQAV